MKNVPTKLIQESRIKLRPINNFSVEFEELKSSIEKNGFKGTLLVRPVGDKFEIIDGSHRFKAIKELGIESVPCDIEEVNDEDAIYLSMVMNSHVIDTKPVEYAKHLMRVLESRKVTLTQVAAKISKSTEWLRQVLTLNKINDPEIENLINTGKISITNAYWLVRVHKPDRIYFVEPAMILPLAEFRDMVKNAIRRKGASYREALQENTEYVRFYAKFRGMESCKQELEKKEFLRRFKQDGSITDIDSAYDMAIKFCLSLDHFTKEKKYYFKRLRKNE